MSFVHLHTHSHYSLLDGLGKIDNLVAKAVEYKMPALALTDHGVMYGVVEFYQQCKKAGIKPIIGVEFYIARNGHKEKNAGIDIKPYHLILLAKNEEGYKSLVKLTSIAHLEGFYYKPRIDWDLLKQYHSGLICSTACLQGELANHIINKNIKAAEKMIADYQNLFGKENFYLEVQHNPSLPQQDQVNKKIFELAKKTQAEVIATNDIHYVEADDAEAQDILLCIQTKKTLADDDRMSMRGEDYSFKSPDDMIKAFSDHPEVIENTLKVAEKCQFELTLGDTVLPHFPLPEGRSADEQLRVLSEQGLIKRYGDNNLSKEYIDRLNYELDIIKKTGYAGYFLIVADFINWAKDNGVVVGPGRGSAAGSFVSYLIEITDIDPIKYNLLFERFLNPERISMPDIDTDFADKRRDDVLKYVSEKYGKDKVAQIITFGTMAARAAIRDVGRVQGLPYSYCDKVAKLIPMFTKLQDAIDTVSELKEIMNEADGKKLLSTALRLEGVVRHASTHACGVVVTPQSLDNYAPRQYGSHGDDSIVVQYEMHAVEDLGLLKMDFLGLSNLTIIETALEIIEKIHNKKIDIGKIPLDDDTALELFRQGKTTGVFQFESAGMKRYLKQLAPTNIEDLIAMVALYRPGPMEYIPDYIDGKHKRKQPHYLHPKLEPILGKTHGVAVYQEQLLQIARDLAGFSYGEADVLRKAVGKKIKELLDEQEHKMIDGMIKNGIEKNTAVKIWEFILPFASYGFNRSHAACYAMIAYQTAYLKANYPAEFMAALLTSDQGNQDRIAIETDECRQMGIEVLSPDINESYSTFTVVAESLNTQKPRIRFGLLAVKGLGENIVKTIIAERKKNGKFINLEDLLRRVKSKDLNKRSLEALIKSGCMDSMGERNKLLENMDKLLLFIAELNQANENQNSLFDNLPEANLVSLKLNEATPLAKRQKLLWEKEYLNLYVSEHPMDEFKPKLGKFVVACDMINEQKKTSLLRVAGIISETKKIITKKGDNMMFAKIEDGGGSVEVLVFPRVLESNPNLWQEDNLIICSGRLSDKDDEPKILCERASILNHEDLDKTIKSFLLASSSPTGKFRNGKIYNRNINERQSSGEIHLTINESLDLEKSKKIKDILCHTPGNYRVYLVVDIIGKNKRLIKTSMTVGISDEMKNELRFIIGNEGIVVK